MTPLWSRPCFTLTLAGLLASVGCRGAMSPREESVAADLVITGARVWTGDALRPWAEAVAIRGAKLVSVGSTADAEALVGGQTKVMKLPGGLVLPGLIDAHVHPLGAGRQELGCSLAELPSIAAILQKVKQCADTTKGSGGFVHGRGWNLSLFPNANPGKKLLDEVVPDRPAYFRGEDGHSGWANSQALALAGITKATKNPEHGIIERDASGEPSGTLREDAIELIEKLLPAPTLADDVAALKLALSHVSAFGITSIMDAGVEERQLEAYQALGDALPVRVVGCIVADLAHPDKAVSRAKALREKFGGNPRLRPTCVKIYLDGVLEGETAALLNPYLDHPQSSGALNVEPAVLAELVTSLEAERFQVHVHVIGDRPTRVALDAFAASSVANGERAKDLRPTLAHLQLVDAADHARFSQLGVIANAQAFWAYPDTYIRDVNTPQVGPERVARMYPFGSLQRAGARIVGGSDWPVSSLNPLDAAEVLVTRQDPKTNAGPVLTDSEKVDIDAALRAYTSQGAFLLHQETETGVLAVGKDADVVVLDRDVTAGAPSAINAARVVLTLLGGRTVYPR